MDHLHYINLEIRLPEHILTIEKKSVHSNIAIGITDSKGKD